MFRFNSILIPSIVFLLILASCNTQEPPVDNGNTTDVFSKVYSTANLPVQIFTIDNSTGNIFTGKSGTIIHIDKNTFVDSDGKLVTGKVNVKLIEALTKGDIVLGNLTTTFNNKSLETGGMLFLDAESGNKKVSIAQGKSIQVKMPTDSTLSGMSFFEGKQDSTGVKWGNPIKLQGKDTISGPDAKIRMESFEMTTNVMYSVDGFSLFNIPPKISSEVSAICWTGLGLKITKDSVFKIDNYTVRFYKQNKLFTYSESFSNQNQKGMNMFAEDLKTNYIFSLRKLGWANIDRLLEDPRTKEVELVTSIENQKEFKFIYVTMITQKMYLPGYQKKDNTFCFSHGDEEKQSLPVGETASILATAYKNDKPFFAIRKFTISDKQKISFKLEETTMEKLKADLKNKI